MRRYNDALIFILANLPMWLGPRQEPRRRPCRRAKYATERQAQHAWQAKKRLAFFCVETAFRAGQDGERAGSFGIGAQAQSRQGIAGWRILVAENEEAVFVPVVEQRVEPDRGSDVWIVRIPHCSAASIACASIRSLLIRLVWVLRVSTGRSRPAPISTAFSTK